MHALHMCGGETIEEYREAIDSKQQQVDSMRADLNAQIERLKGDKAASLADLKKRHHGQAATA